MASAHWQRLRRDITGRILYPRFQKIVRETGGLMRAKAYRRLCELARDAADLDIVEVGAGGGGSGISMALGVQEAGKHSRVVVIDRCEGASRLEIGGYDDNLAFLHGNLERFGVADRVRVCPFYLTEETAGKVFEQVESEQLAGLAHDADGRIDRDFTIFWPRLIDGGFIAIDDCRNRAPFQPRTPRTPDGGIKSLVTFRLLQRFTEWGLFRETDRVRGTVFGVKPAGADLARFDPAVCAEIIAGVERERRAYLDARGLTDDIA